METYKEILDRMRSAYMEKSGVSPEDVSDIGLRLQVLAGELYRAEARMDWLWRQAFPHTADGPQLDLHGAQRGVLRKESRKAAGVLAFSRYVPITFDLVIPKGTVCAAYGDEAVEYETTEDGILPAGKVTVEVPAQAVAGGSKGNAAASYINTLVTEVNGINYVVNPAPFTGGTDSEDDEAYRRRILEAYSRPLVWGNAAYYENIALSREGVTDAQAVPRENGAGTVSVYVWGDKAAPSAETLAALEGDFQEMGEAGVAVTVKAATTRRCNLSCYIKVRPEADFAKAKAAVQAALARWFGERKIGDAVYLGDLNRVILDADPAISRVTFPSGNADVEGTAGVVPVAGGTVIGGGI